MDFILGLNNNLDIEENINKYLEKCAIFQENIKNYNFDLVEIWHESLTNFLLKIEEKKDTTSPELYDNCVFKINNLIDDIESLYE